MLCRGREGHLLCGRFAECVRSDSEPAPVVPPLLFRYIGHGVERTAFRTAFVHHLQGAAAGAEFERELSGVGCQVRLFR